MISAVLGRLPMEDDGNPLNKLGQGVGDAIGGVKDLWNGATGAVGNAVTFAADPLGSIFKATRDGAVGLAKDVLPALAHATQPDLSVDWFLKAYAISFAVGILIWGVLLLGQFVAVARGQMSGEAFLEALVGRTFLFFGGALFGPMIGTALVSMLGALTDSLISWGVSSSSDKMLASLQTMLGKDPGAIPGGVIVGILLMVVMIVGLFLVLVTLAIMLVTLYLSGAVMPIGLVWIASHRHSEFGKKIPVLWLGILAAHPLLFFMLGISWNIIAASSNWMLWSDGLKTLMNLMTAVIAMAIASLAPLLLLKFAPIMPSGAAGQQGPSINAPQKSYGESSLSEVRQARSSSSEAGDAATDGGAGETGGGSGSEGGGGSDGTLMRRLRQLGSSGDASSADAAAESAGTAAGSGGPAGSDGGSGGTKPAGAAAGADHGSQPASGESAGGEASQPAGAKSAGGSAPSAGRGKAPAGAVGSPAGGAGGAGAGAAGTAEAGAGAESLAAAGAAETGTGIGAVIGIPTLAAAAGAKAAEMGVDAAKATARASEAAGQTAVDNMQDETER